MGVIWTPWERTEQPASGAVIAWDNPLSRGLRGAWGVNSNDLLANVVPQSVGRLTANNDPSRVLTNGNVRAIELNGSNQYLTNTANSAVTGIPCSMFTVMRYDGGETTRVFDISPGTGFATVIGIQVVASNTISAQHFNNPTNARADASVAAYVGKFVPVCAVFESQTSRKIYVNGQLIAANTTDVSASTATDRVTLGYAPWSNSEYFDGALGASFLFNRALSAGEVAELSRNPWQLFEPENDPAFYSLAAGGTTVAVPAGALTLTGYAPTVSFTAHQTIAVPAGALTLTGFAPTVSTSASQTIAVPAASLTLTGFAPTVAATANQTIAVPAGALTLTGFAPTVSTSAAQTIAVPAASLTLTGFAPTVAATANQSISVPAGSLTLTGYAPTVQNGANYTVDVPAGTLTLTGYAPTVSYTTHAYIGVPAGALTLTGYAPTVIGGTSSIWTPASASGGTWTPQ